MAAIDDLRAKVTLLENAVASKTMEINNLRAQLAAIDPAALDEDIAEVTQRVATAASRVQSL